MTERILFLHIGHDKTGSTALQAAFSASRQTLRGHGIDYPVSGDDAREVNLDRMVPTGNARHLLKSPDELRRQLAALPDHGLSVLFSSELMFNLLARHNDITFVGEAARVAGFSEIRVLLFIRDPLPHAVSVWQQRVKGWEGETLPLDRWLAECYSTPERVRRVISALRSTGIRLTVRHYDRVRRRLVEEAEAWLGIPEGILSRPESRINRSLTAGEAALQRAMNARIGASGKVFGFRLVNRLPDLPPDPPVPSPAAQKSALQRLCPTLGAVDALLPAECRYNTDLLPTSAGGESTYRFSEAQLDIIAEGIAELVGGRAESEAISPQRRFLSRAIRAIRSSVPRP